MLAVPFGAVLTRALLVTARWPWPAQRGDQLRAVQFLETLGGAGCSVTLLTPAPSAAQESLPERWRGDASLRVETYRRGPGDRLQGLRRSVFAGAPLQSVPFVSRDLERRLGELAAGHDLVVVQLARQAELLRALPAGRAYVDLIDCLSLSFARRAHFDRPLWRPLIRWEASRLRRAERFVLEQAAGVSVVCGRDRDALLALDADAATKVAVVPLPVAARPSAPAPPPVGAPRVILSGSLGYFVNRDAALWFLRAVWPSLRRARPEAVLELAGSRIGIELRRAARRPGVELVREPTDLRGRIAAASVAVAPLRAGAGVPVKILEAWTLGVPVVASSWAAAGTLARDGEQLLVAESPEAWCAAVGSLLDDRALVRRVTGAARALVESEYSQATADRALLGHFERLGIVSRLGL
jgi:glycosyltransferase involved in cell wall biosynthesis